MKVLNYPGSKWGMAAEIVGMMPPHRSYVEPFFGSGAVFFNKPRSPIETINDLDEDVVNFFRVLRKDPQRLAREVALIPYARAEYEEAWERIGRDEVDRAVRFLIRCNMAFGCKRHNKTGFKIDIAGREAGYAVENWNLLPRAIHEAAERLKEAQIENRPALEIIRRFDDPDVLMYIDPPYLPSTRTQKQYSHEMTKEDHEALLGELLKTKARVILSGYASKLYDGALTEWHRRERRAYAQGAKARTEVIWCNFEPEEEQMSLL